MSASRVALVTGASRGLGREIAVALASSSSAVLVHYFRNRKGAEATARAVRRAGAESDVLQADITVEKEARGLGLIHDHGTLA